jgi:hypothetical protein
MKNISSSADWFTNLLLALELSEPVKVFIDMKLHSTFQNFNNVIVCIKDIALVLKHGIQTIGFLL